MKDNLKICIGFIRLEKVKIVYLYVKYNLKIMFNYFIVWVFVFDCFFFIFKILFKIDLIKGNFENLVLC